MSEVKISGACTLCDAMCFEVLGVFEEHERRPGEPKQLGVPNPDAVRISFVLFDGTKTGLTFCGECASSPLHEQYTPIWRKNIRSWQRQLSDKSETERNPEWFLRQFSNGILCEMGRQQWTELVKNG